MTARARLKAELAAVRAQIRDGALDLAQARLEEIGRDADLAALGELTLLGLPRKYQSVLLALAKARGDGRARLGLQYFLVPEPSILAPYARFSEDERRQMAAAARQEVPAVLHQVWIGPRPVPPTVAAWRAHAAAHGLTHRLWREADLDAAGIEADPMFAAMRARGDFPGAVDVARYHILRDHGGLYLDCDWYPARQDIGLADRLPMRGLMALAEEVPRMTGAGSVLLANSFIGAPPGHPALVRITEVLPQVLADLPDAPAWWATGPLLFTVIARAGAVVLAEAGLIAAPAPEGATAETLAARAAARHEGGLLMAWKPW